MGQRKKGGRLKSKKETVAINKETAKYWLSIRIDCVLASL